MTLPAVAALAGALVVPPAAPDPAPSERVVSASAVQSYARVAAGADAGFSEVLVGPAGRCLATGAGVRVPGDDGANPTLARAGTGDGVRGRDRRPVLDARGPGAPQWSAECTPGGNAGRASGATVGGPAYDGAGSASAAFLDPATGEYVGTARSFVSSLTTPAGVVGTLTSFVRVTTDRHAQPKVTYRLGLYGVRTPGRASAGFDSDGVSVAGDEVPVTGMAEQFARQAGDLAAGLAGLRLTLVAPTYEQSRDGYRFTAPAVALAGPAGAHVCTAAFSGR